MENQEISKNYSNILMEKQLLRLMYYYHLVCSVLTMSYIQKIYLILFCFISPIINIIVFILSTIYFISIIIPQSFSCQRIIVTSNNSNKLHIGITISRSYAFSINGTLVLKISFLFLVLA